MTGPDPFPKIIVGQFSQIGATSMRTEMHTVLPLNGSHFVRKPALPFPGDPDGRLKYEMLIADLSARSINVPAGQVGAEMQNALRQIVEALNLDRSSLWQVDEHERVGLWLIELLPYMRFGESKYGFLGRVYEMQDFGLPAPETLARLRAIIDEAFGRKNEYPTAGMNKQEQPTRAWL